MKTITVAVPANYAVFYGIVASIVFGCVDGSSSTTERAVRDQAHEQYGLGCSVWVGRASDIMTLTLEIDAALCSDESALESAVLERMDADFFSNRAARAKDNIDRFVRNWAWSGAEIGTAAGIYSRTGWLPRRDDWSDVSDLHGSSRALRDALYEEECRLVRERAAKENKR